MLGTIIDVSLSSAARTAFSGGTGYAWGVLEHLGYEELAEAYVKPTGRKLESLALERVVYAEKLWATADADLTSGST